jgi:hypothetical protein
LIRSLVRRTFRISGRPFETTTGRVRDPLSDPFNNPNEGPISEAGLIGRRNRKT